MLRAMVIAAVGLFVLAGCGAAGPAEGGCAGPTLQAEPNRAAPGESFRLHGEWFRVGCNDTGQDRAEPPDRDIRLGLRQDGRSWRLATVDAERDYSFDTKLTVPEGAGPGRAVLFARSSSGVTKEPFRVLEGMADLPSRRMPPDSTLSFEGRSVTGVLGSYCWSYRTSGNEGGAMCVDVAEIPVPDESATLTVPAGSELVFEYGGSERGTSVEAGAYPLRRGEPVRSESRKLRSERRGERTVIPADLPPGEYLVDAFVRVPGGDVSYYYRVLVEPAAGGGSS